MNNFYKAYFKRVLDIIFSIIGLIISIPIVAVVIILLFVTGHRSFFFIQQRIGFKERPFNLIKIKTMLDKKHFAKHMDSDEKRLTKTGRFLRKLSLDEIPQLINVLKGDMSIVGPRPLLVEYLPLYSIEQRKRHLVKPGITGWAQIKGRNLLKWDQKFEYDVWYVENQSLCLDLKIVLLTIKKIIISEGINAEGHATVEPFKG